MTVTFGAAGTGATAAGGNMGRLAAPRGRSHEVRAEEAIRWFLPAGAVIGIQASRRRFGGWLGSECPGVHLECLSGELWVTRAGDPVDYRLTAGEHLEARPGERLVVQALSDASLCLGETRGGP